MDPVIETLIAVIQDKMPSAVHGLELINAVLERAMDLLKENAQFIGERPSDKVKAEIAHGIVLGHSASVEIGEERIDPPQVFGWNPNG